MSEAKGAGVFIALGILNIILGIILIGSPFFAGLATAILLGAIILVGGIVELVHAFGAKNWKSGILKFIGGVLLLLVGVAFMFRPLLGLVLLGGMVAVFFIIDGIFRIILAFNVKPLSGWGWLLFGGIVTLLLGGYVLANWPASSLVIIGLLVGIRMLFAGLTMIFAGAAVKSIAAQEAE